MTSIVLNKFKGLLGSYHSIFFLGEPLLGLIIFGLTWIHPNIALSGLLSLLIALGFLAILKIPQTSPLWLASLINVLLVGLDVGYCFNLNFRVLVLLVFTTLMTLVIVFALEAWLSPMLLPLLSLPFTLTAFVLAFATSAFSDAVAPMAGVLVSSPMSGSWALPASLDWSLDFFRAIGTIFCTPDVRFGLLVWLAVGLFSPLNAIFLACGFCLSHAMALFFFNPSIGMLGGMSDGTHGGILVGIDSAAAFNYSLIFTGLAGYFLMPSLFSLAVASGVTMLAVLFSQATATFLQPFHMPVIALPFNLMILLTLRTLRSTLPERLTVRHARSPEAALESVRLFSLRHRSGEAGIFCPFSDESALEVKGTWQVQQGFNGEWTHQGNWRHALDFVILGSSGKTFEGRGIELEDYFVFGRAILSPVEGYVVTAYGALADSAIGRVENEKNWGNLVVIRALAGFYVVLAHLKKDSLTVKAGDYVTVGKQVGSCGNSGYSQEPHLHLQLQYTPEIGSYTMPFHLLNYRRVSPAAPDLLIFHGLPQKNALIRPIVFNLAMDRVLTFEVGQVQRWKLNDKEFEIKRCLDPIDGRFYWFDGKSRLYDARLGAQYYFYELEGRRSPLWDLFTAAPRIPMTFGNEIVFEDYLPLKIWRAPMARFFLLVRQMMTGSLDQRPVRYVLDPTRLELKGELGSDAQGGNSMTTFCKLDPLLGWVDFKVGDRHYVRMP